MRKDLKKVKGVCQANILGKSKSGTREMMCKGPEIQVYLECLRNCKKIWEAGAVNEGRIVESKVKT